MQTLEVEVDVNEAYIARIGHGQDSRITLDAYPDTAFRGSVRQVVPTADRQRATVQVKVSILDRDPRILPEMGARVDFLEPDTVRTAGTEAKVLIRLPAAVVRQYQGQTVVWLVPDLEDVVADYIRAERRITARVVGDGDGTDTPISECVRRHSPDHIDRPACRLPSGNQLHGDNEPFWV